MKLSTKTIASLLAVTTVAAAVPGISKYMVPSTKHKSQFDRLFRRHDRKGEIQSAVLGMAPMEYRSQLKRFGQEELLARAGFKNTREYRRAIAGYLRNELKNRGWTVQQIDAYIGMKYARGLA